MAVGASGATIVPKCFFADGTTKDVSIGEIAVSAINDTVIKNQIKKLNNATTREESYPGFTTGFVSAGGADFVSIRACEIVVSRKTVIY